MFSNPTQIDTNILEAVVMSTDVKRFYCNVRTERGQSLSNVKFIMAFGGNGRGGNHSMPQPGDRVVINTGLGYPLIIGMLPSLDTGVETFSPGLDTTDVSLDSSSSGTGLDSTSSYNPNKPKDIVTGDYILTTEGGGMLALLKTGSVLIRASRLCQILFSKFDDLLRVISRNLEVFTDVYADYSVNWRNRLYRYTGYVNSMEDSLSETYKMEQIWGNVSAGLTAKGSYSSLSSLAAPGSVIFHENVTTKMTHTYELDGAVTRTVVNSGTTYTRHEGSKWHLNLVNGSYADILVTESAITLDFNGISKVVIDQDKVFVNHHDKSTVTLDETQAKMDYMGTAFCKLTANRAELGTDVRHLILSSSGMSIS